MKDFELVQNFFCNMHCSKCNSVFEPEGIILLKEESNYFVVKISCVVCKQQVGIAIVGISSKSKLQHDMIEELIENDTNLINELPPISYDDVIDAHYFFSKLDANWVEHINKLHKHSETDE